MMGTTGQQPTRRRSAPQAVISPGGLVPELDLDMVFFCALLACSRAQNVELVSVLDQLRCEDKRIHSRFRYSLGRQIAAYIGNSLQEVDRIYIHGSSVEDTAVPNSDIDLLAVSREPDRLKELVEMLNERFADYYHRYFFSRQFINRLLNIRIVEEIDSIEKCKFRPPMLIWPESKL